MTSRQQEIVHFIDLFWEEHWTSPTVREIGTAMGIKSTQSVADYLRRMVRDGILERHQIGARVLYRVCR